MKPAALYEKAASIAIKLGQICRWVELRPEDILRAATAKEIDFYYGRMCADERNNHIRKLQ